MDCTEIQLTTEACFTLESQVITATALGGVHTLMCHSYANLSSSVDTTRLIEECFHKLSNHCSGSWSSYSHRKNPSIAVGTIYVTVPQLRCPSCAVVTSMA